MRESSRAGGPERILSDEAKRHSVDQIVSKLRKADVELGKGKKVPEVCKELEVAEQTYYRHRRRWALTRRSVRRPKQWM